MTKAHEVVLENEGDSVLVKAENSRKKIRVVLMDDDLRVIHVF